MFHFCETQPFNIHWLSGPISPLSCANSFGFNTFVRLWTRIQFCCYCLLSIRPRRVPRILRVCWSIYRQGQLFMNPSCDELELELEPTRVNLSSRSRQQIDNTPFSFDFPPHPLILSFFDLPFNWWIETLRHVVITMFFDAHCQQQSRGREFWGEKGGLKLLNLGMKFKAKTKQTFITR